MTFVVVDVNIRAKIEECEQAICHHGVGREDWYSGNLL
jgi:hypothetical protein